ncbi:hypothetical protein PGT21_023016 [Puccinia graminis f. sp. tritici]|uniref:Uncharacterized protein n=2 Tax=Puccinia graminis f. sp. tritici TaxID=56615 RepID=E3L655_PUCGT|nr:uncharacterized protein PGTG_17861 [Puccinia graminis f. sp. tritici CRL 75-36-700-3]EFP92030.2 hypothetical protein PGTG_17861 [Puccinia graminis f. sp. tritici CRL 75-36-700-3]KAA1114786.1 hypothetical protein PGT21_023016 [Puccinia graminis f. sp. tritici]
MQLRARDLLFTLAVLATTVANAQQRPKCPRCPNAYGIPCTPAQMEQFNLSATGQCRPNCHNIVEKGNYMCAKCPVIFRNNPGYSSKSLSRPCHHYGLEVIRDERGIMVGSTPPSSGPSEPGSSQPEDEESPYILHHFI